MCETQFLKDEKTPSPKESLLGIVSFYCTSVNDVLMSNGALVLSNQLLKKRLIKMCQAKRAFIKELILEGYPDGLFADEIEQQIQASLPVIPELIVGLSKGVEVAVISELIERQRAAFVRQWGDPLWSDTCDEIASEEPVHSPTEQIRFVPLQA